MLDYVLIVGASVSAMSFGTPSVGHLIAKRLDAPVVVSAHAGAKLDEVMPSDEVVRRAALVVSVDGFYWYAGRKEDCEMAQKTANHLFDVRGERPMILAEVPTESSGAECINPLLEARCTNYCILVKPERFAGLHPDKAYMERALGRLYERASP